MRPAITPDRADDNPDIGNSLRSPDMFERLTAIRSTPGFQDSCRDGSLPRAKGLLRTERPTGRQRPRNRVLSRTSSWDRDRFRRNATVQVAQVSS